MRIGFWLTKNCWPVYSWIRKLFNKDWPYRLDEKYKQKMRDLAYEYRLSFTFNPGGGEYNVKSFRCQISTYDDVDDYKKLKKAIKEFKLKPVIYKWCAIVDDRTCDKCAELNGKLLTAEDIQSSVHPPLHGGKLKEDKCRCYLELLE